MVFDVTVEKNVIINGKVVTFKAGKVDTDDEQLIAVLSKCKGVKEVVKKRKSK